MIDGRIQPDGTIGGIDFYLFNVDMPSTQAVVSLLDATPALPDSRIGLFSPTGALLMSRTGVGVLSMTFPSLSPGLYRVAVTGAADSGFTGNGHSNQFNYRIILGTTTVPAPGASMLLLLAGACAARRRR